jgi:DNA invertase Pin-like site-specific DNA recombinase
VTRRFALYARFSTELQNAASIEDQERVCRDYVGRMHGTVVATYRDRAVSGAHTVERKGYRALLADAEAKRFDAIVAEDLDRFTRDMEESARLLRRMAFHGVEIHTVRAAGSARSTARSKA